MASPSAIGTLHDRIRRGRDAVGRLPSWPSGEQIGHFDSIHFDLLAAWARGTGAAARQRPCRDDPMVKAFR